MTRLFALTCTLLLTIVSLSRNTNGFQLHAPQVGRVSSLPPAFQMHKTATFRNHRQVTATTLAAASARTAVASNSKGTKTVTKAAGKAVKGKAAKAAAATAAAVTSVTLPTWAVVSLACFLPTCLGFWKREYGVSYAYGTATAATAALVFKSIISASPAGNVAAWHAGALMFYGIRLNLFLLYRELFVKRIKDGIKKIEINAELKEKNRFLDRAPFILSCSFLYYGLCAPLFVTAQLGIAKPMAKWVQLTLKGLVGLTWFGFGLAALGDFNKSLIKMIKGEKHLVTGGVYRYIRHPNYTGEIIGWTANCLAGILAAVVEDGAIKKLNLVGYILASVLGMAGINSVLLGATNGLEKRQKKDYGDTTVYDAWVKKSWSGWKLEKKAEEDSHVEPHIELEISEEETGSGI